MGLTAIMDAVGLPTGKLDVFIRSVEIASYMPGRIRLYSKNLIGNENLSREIKGELARFAELKEVETNTVSGSVLIKYEPAILQRNAELVKAEQYIMAHAKKRTM